MNTGKILALAVVLTVTAGLTAVASQTSGTSSAKQASPSDTHTKDTMTLHHETEKSTCLAADQFDHRSHLERQRRENYIYPRFRYQEEGKDV